MALRKEVPERIHFAVFSSEMIFESVICLYISQRTTYEEYPYIYIQILLSMVITNLVLECIQRLTSLTKRKHMIVYIIAHLKHLYKIPKSE